MPQIFLKTSMVFLLSLYSSVGSAKEAEIFDHLQPEESKKRLRMLLTKIDLNNDHFIDPEELYAWIVKSFKLVM